ncbi:ATP-binding protein [Patescibacteria group bacterium]|nr:ATP-binding protein [Patescibacteria group bacterium]
MPKKLLITGGPGGGKSTIIRSLKEEFEGRIVCVQEAATLLLATGFPPPGESPHPDDLVAFQRKIFTTIMDLEYHAMSYATREGIPLVVCDRGLLDGEAYMNSREEFMRTVGITDRAMFLNGYDEVLYVESPAPSADFVWSRTAGNEHRMEHDRSIAAKIEGRTWEAWRDHPKIRHIPHTWGFQGKGVIVRARVLELLE